MSQQLFALALVKAGKTSDNLLKKFILSSLLPERWGDKFLSDGGPVKLSFEWGVVLLWGAYRKAIRWEDSITSSEKIGNYVEKISE